MDFLSTTGSINKYYSHFKNHTNYIHPILQIQTKMKYSQSSVIIQLILSIA